MPPTIETMAVPTLEANKVSVEFSGLRALDEVSLKLSVGEIVGLIGPNGSGKTTLVNTLTGQIRPCSGSVICDQEEVTGKPPREIALRGVMRSFQIVRLFKGLTVMENVESAALAQGASLRTARKTASLLLREFDLLSYSNQLANTLNYGDERRVEIVRALAGSPQFLLLDEPAAGMNEVESGNLLNILAQLPDAKGLGMLIIDHDMSLIMRLCQRLHVLASGKTIGEGSVEQVRKLPAVVEAYLGSGFQLEKSDA